jgi:tetratricopeptide (TPR) repeat protein
MGSKRSARRKKNAQAVAARQATITNEPTKSAVTGDVLSDPFFRADSLAPAELDARAGARETALEDRSGAPQTWSAQARARRARFGKYVAMTVGACAVVCALAGVRHAVGARSHATIAKRDAAIRPPPAPLAPLPPATADEVAPTSDVTPPERFVESTENDRDVARREKRASQRALELGHVTEAIELGEKAVAVDPTDRETWLILGAAYQHAGAQEDARRCFQACLTQGKRGATWECSAMLR